MIDSEKFLRDHELREKGGGGSDQKSQNLDKLFDMYLEQVQTANVLLLNKIDLISPAQVERLEAILRVLNPKAKICRTTFSQIDLAEILDLRLFDKVC